MRNLSRILGVSLLGAAVLAGSPAWTAPLGEGRFTPLVTPKVRAPVAVEWASAGGQAIGESFETTVELLPRADYRRLVVKAGADGGVAVVREGVILERGAGTAGEAVSFSVRGQRVDAAAGRVHLTVIFTTDAGTSGRSVVVEFGGESPRATTSSPGRLDSEARLRIMPAAENDRSDRPVPN